MISCLLNRFDLNVVEIVVFEVVVKKVIAPLKQAVKGIDWFERKKEMMMGRGGGGGGVEKMWMREAKVKERAIYWNQSTTLVQ